MANKLAIYVIGAVMLAAAAKGNSGGGSAASLLSFNATPLPAGWAGQAISYAAAQEGKSYCLGGIGSSCYDCSGLVMQAWVSAGVLPAGDRITTSTMWADLPHVDPHHVEPGDAVMIVGADGTWASPGHTMLVVDPRKHLAIEAYSYGVPIRLAYYGRKAGNDGDQNVVGFVAPPGGA